MGLTRESINEYLKRVNNFRKEVFADMQKRSPGQLWREASLEDAKNLVVICSSSRSGSSLLFEALRRLPLVYALPGESLPYYKLHGLSLDCFPSEKTPGHLLSASFDYTGISRDFLNDFSYGDECDIFKDSNLLQLYIDDIILRLPLQWPNILFRYQEMRELVYKAITRFAARDETFIKEKFYLELFHTIKEAYPGISPCYYDIKYSDIRGKFCDIKLPVGPPNQDFLVEEPPFILLSPRKKVTKKELTEKTLLLKSSVDCYKTDLIEFLFPNAEIKVIYMTRNPAATINGLYDGWSHRGFFSRNLKILFEENDFGRECLGIKAYSDKYRYEWAKWWWNYDLPQGWEDYIESELETVCAFQWYSANYAIQEYLARGKSECCTVKYENLIRSPLDRKREFTKILDFMGLDTDYIEAMDIEHLPIVQATVPPKPYRWHNRKEIIIPQLEEEKIVQMSHKLDYRIDKLEEWL